ncbi:hypothetical protein GLU01_00310 [Nanohaloarchaea archaeon]|nr:hypothetical protein [Candidatus Nanohaloarchaea archaeon]
MIKRLVLLALVSVLVLLVATGATTVEHRTNEISFSTLKTKCLIDTPMSSADYEIDERRLRFDGHFPVKGAEPDVGYRYRQTKDTILFAVNSSSGARHTDFSGECMSSAVYDAVTPRIKPGRYLLQIRHNGGVKREAYISVGE